METHSRQLRVFNQAYQQYYHTFAWRCERSVKDEVTASGMVQDAFLKLWLLRDQLSVEEIYDFLKKQVKQLLTAYYSSDRFRFDKKLFSLDDFDSADFLMVNLEDNEQLAPADSGDVIERDERWLKLQQVVARLGDGQQQLVKLCLRHNFDYGRIAYYLGGISDYEVGNKINGLVESLRHILTDGNKLEAVGRTGQVVFKGQLNELQKSVLQMRYELAYSFGEMAKALALSEAQVKTAYAQACRVCR